MCELRIEEAEDPIYTEVKERTDTYVKKNA